MCLRRRCRYLPRQLVADEARRGDGGAIVFQRARQIDGMRGGLWAGSAYELGWIGLAWALAMMMMRMMMVVVAVAVVVVLVAVAVAVVVVITMISTAILVERGARNDVSRKL